MIKLLRFFNTLSFDTALGAASFVLLVSYSQQIKIDHFIYAAIITSVLSIYNIDHLIDATKLADTTPTYRHSFYKKNFSSLIIWQILLVALGLVILFNLPIQLLWAGAALAVSIGIYFLVIFYFANANLIFREVIVAIGYTLAVGLIPFLSSRIHFSLNFLWMLCIIFLVALTNLWVFSIYDVKVDNGQNHHSIARIIGVNNLQNLVRLVILLALLAIIAYSFWFGYWLVGGSLIFTEFIYFLLLEKKSFFAKNEIYRLVGESVLMLPGVVLLIGHAI